MKISGTYTPTKWEEMPYELIEEGMKATKASVEFTFSGDIEGKANVEFLMFYQSFDLNDSHKAKAQYVGLLRIVGSVKGKSGSFVATDNGNYENGTANSNLSIIPNSGTGELSTIRGAGTSLANQSGCTWEFEVFI